VAYAPWLPQAQDDAPGGWIERPAQPSPDIVIFGESLPLGTLVSGSYRNIGTVLQTLLPSIAVTTYAVGAQRTESIFARAGGIPFEIGLPNDTIPPTTDPVVLTWRSGDPMTDQGVQNLDALVGGVAVTIARLSNNLYTLTRKAAGPSVVIGPQSRSLFDAARDTAATTQIWWAYRNDLSGELPVDGIVSRSRRQHRWLRALDKRFVSMGPLYRRTAIEFIGGANRAYMDSFDSAAEAIYGARHLALNGYMASTAPFEARNLTPSTDDLSDIANGVPARRWMRDTQHTNTDGDAVIVEDLLLPKLQTLRYVV
jgi:hypothetical protein